MAETVTRDVVMRLKLVADPGNAGVAKAVAAEAQRAKQLEAQAISAVAKAEQDKTKLASDSLAVQKELNAAVTLEQTGRQANLKLGQEAVALERERLRLATERAKLETTRAAPSVSAFATAAPTAGAAPRGAAAEQPTSIDRGLASVERDLQRVEAQIEKAAIAKTKFNDKLAAEEAKAVQRIQADIENAGAKRAAEMDRDIANSKKADAAKMKDAAALAQSIDKQIAARAKAEQTLATQEAAAVRRIQADIDKAKQSQLADIRRAGQATTQAQQAELAGLARIQAAVDKVGADRQRQAGLGQKLGISDEGAKQLDSLRTMGATHKQQAEALRGIRLADQQKTLTLLENAERTGAVKRASLEQRAFQASQASSQALARAAGGGMQLAKGAVMAGMFADSDKDLEKLVKNLAKAEIAFQALRGGLDVVLGLRQGFVMWQRSALAVAQANALLAASNVTVATTGAAAAAVGGGGVIGGATKAAAGGGIAKTVAAVGVGVAGQQVATGGMAALGASLKGAAASAGALAAKFVVLPLAAAELVQANRRFYGALASGATYAEASSAAFSRVEGAGESIISALLSWRTAVANAEASTEKLTKAEEAFQRQKQQRAATESRIDRMGAFASEARKREAASRETIVGFTVGLDKPDNERKAEQEAQNALAARKERDDLEARFAERTAERQRNLGGDQMQFIRAQLAAVNDLENAQAKVVAHDQKRLEALHQVVTESKAAVQHAKEQLRISSDAVKSEQEKYNAQLAAFGKLSKGEQEYIKQLAARVEAGKELSVFEAEYLKKRGIGKEIVEKTEAKAGVEAGGEGALATFGGRTALTTAEEREAENKRQIAENERKAAEAAAEASRVGVIGGKAVTRQQELAARKADIGEDVAGDAGLNTGQRRDALTRGAKAFKKTIDISVDDIRETLQQQEQDTTEAFERMMDEVIAGQRRLQADFERRQAEMAANR